MSLNTVTKLTCMFVAYMQTKPTLLKKNLIKSLFLFSSQTLKSQSKKYIHLMCVSFAPPVLLCSCRVGMCDSVCVRSRHTDTDWCCLWCSMANTNLLPINPQPCHMLTHVSINVFLIQN